MADTTRDTLATWLRSQYATGAGGSGSWDDAGYDRAYELADMMIKAGVTSPGDLELKDLTGQTWSAEMDSQGNAMPGSWSEGLLGQQLMIGGVPVGYLGDYNNDGTYGSKAQDTLITKGDEQLLGWSARGDGNTSYRIITDPNTGKLVIAPGWNSSSDASDFRQAGVFLGGAALGGLGATGTLAGAAGLSGASGAALSGAATGAGMNMVGTQEITADTLKAGLLGGATGYLGFQGKELLKDYGLLDSPSNFGNPEIDNLVPQLNEYGYPYATNNYGNPEVDNLIQQVDEFGNPLGQLKPFEPFDYGQDLYPNPDGIKQFPSEPPVPSYPKEPNLPEGQNPQIPPLPTTPTIPNVQLPPVTPGLLDKINPGAVAGAVLPVVGEVIGGGEGGDDGTAPPYDGPMPTITRGDWKPSVTPQYMQIPTFGEGFMSQTPTGNQNSGLWRYAQGVMPQPSFQQPQPPQMQIPQRPGGMQATGLLGGQQQPTQQQGLLTPQQMAPLVQQSYDAADQGFSGSGFVGVGGAPISDRYTWGGDPASKIMYDTTVHQNEFYGGPGGMSLQDASKQGYYNARDDKTGEWLWVKAGQMVPWQG